VSIGDRVALVTGAGRGIGAAVAIALGAQGARVVVTSRNEAQLKDVAAAITRAGGRALPVVADVGDPAAVDALADAARRAFGPVELLVSNAAVVQPLGSVWTLPQNEWESAVRTNLLGAQLVLRAFVPDMVTAGFGRIVAVGSSAATHAVAGLGGYAAGKAGFEMLHAAAAADLAGTGVLVNRLWPGGTDTEMQAELRTDAFPHAALTRRVHAEGRLRSAEEVAPHVLRLLADELAISGSLTDLGEPGEPAREGSGSTPATSA
jgi:NAD(P)-dependent dehydrogenase (short-subunit alcohol dehydrogenase family)